jgi:hypothetical protein
MSWWKWKSNGSYRLQCLGAAGMIPCGVCDVVFQGVEVSFVYKFHTKMNGIVKLSSRFAEERSSTTTQHPCYTLGTIESPQGNLRMELMNMTMRQILKFWYTVRKELR